MWLGLSPLSHCVRPKSSGHKVPQHSVRNLSKNKTSSSLVTVDSIAIAELDKPFEAHFRVDQLPSECNAMDGQCSMPMCRTIDASDSIGNAERWRRTMEKDEHSFGMDDSRSNLHISVDWVSLSFR